MRTVKFEPPLELKPGRRYMICPSCQRGIVWVHRNRHLRSRRHVDRAARFWGAVDRMGRADG